MLVSTHLSYADVGKYMFFVVDVDVVGPSYVPTSDALLVPASLLLATPKTHATSRPRPQRFTGSDVRSLVGCHPK